MILDALLKVSAAQQITADAASTNEVDLGNVTPKRRIGGGEPMGFFMGITAVGTNTGSSKVQVVQSAASGLGTPTIIGELDLAAGALVAGGAFVIPIGRGIAALRYIGMYHDITGTVDYTVDAYGPLPLSLCSALAETYAKGYAI